MSDLPFGRVESNAHLLSHLRRMPSMSEFCVPKSLQLLPLFITSAIKSPLLRQALPRRGTGTRDMVPSPRGDERSYYFQSARQISPSAALLLVHPLLLDLGSNLGDGSDSGAFNWQNLQEPGVAALDPMASLKNSPVLSLPSPLPATVANLAQDGIYLLDTCFALYVLIERDAFDSGPDMQNKVTDAVTQLQIWTQIGRESKCLRPTASVPVVYVHQQSDPAQYQTLMKWMLLDATSYDKDFRSICMELNRRIIQTAEGK